MNKRIFVTGSNGMIGSRLVKSGCSPFVSDVTDVMAVDLEMSRCKPDVLIHLASKSNVNFCETNRKESTNVNWRGVLNVFSMAEKHKIPVVFVSSDHIFSGNRLGAYSEHSDDKLPQNYYGYLKLSSEAAADSFDNVKIVRTSTLFYKERDIVSHYLRDAANGDKVYPPIRIWRSFMHIDHFCSSLLDYAAKIDHMPKVLNISGTHNVSWWKFIRDYVSYLGMDTRLVVPRWSTSKSLEAPRPMRAGLCVNKSSKYMQTYSYTEGFDLG